MTITTYNTGTVCIYCLEGLYAIRDFGLWFGSYYPILNSRYMYNNYVELVELLSLVVCQSVAMHRLIMYMYSFTPHRLFFVIECVNGGDLMFHMQRHRRLPEEHARFYSSEIALALNFLHERGV